jgi:hypothetical protein
MRVERTWRVRGLETPRAIARLPAIIVAAAGRQPMALMLNRAATWPTEALASIGCSPGWPITRTGKRRSFARWRPGPRWHWRAASPP